MHRNCVSLNTHWRISHIYHHLSLIYLNNTSPLANIQPISQKCPIPQLRNYSHQQIFNSQCTFHTNYKPKTAPNSFQNPLTLKSPPSHLKPLTSQINVCTAYDWNMIYSRIFALYQQQLKVTFHWQNMYFPYSYHIFSKIS